MDDNLKIYNAVREVPQEAQKPIRGGRLNGKTDINPMWRIKVLTEQFGPCGIGWYTEILNNWLEPAPTDEITAHVKIALRVKVDGEWSQPIIGIGGSMYVANEKSGFYTSDECFKMAYTDAISVACKMLGIGADVYWSSDRSKYDQNAFNAPQKPSLTSDMLVPDLFEQIIEAKQKAKTQGNRFSTLSFLESKYIVDNGMIKKINDLVTEYYNFTRK